ncbi:hypothetical protein Taro_038013 [Colocasia esculenta]|uniref:CCHC-type domain-containing protein n=1 Tax=Colocasia esculenta TaxID=4460 RepID=A0A843WEK1_COLES|nr:hypothetical protein [Colocasia esculenta]
MFVAPLALTRDVACKPSPERFVVLLALVGARPLLTGGGTKFANCFICNEQGHLSKNCPKNTHGIYPKGGGCKVCGGVTHLAKDCPKKGNKGATASGLENGSGDHDKVWQGNHTVFRSGDDLEDDFTIEEDATRKKTKTSDSQSDLVSSGVRNKNDANIKVKKKKGPKVVNFLG